MTEDDNKPLLDFIRHVNLRDHILNSCIDDPYAWEFLVNITYS